MFNFEPFDTQKRNVKFCLRKKYWNSAKNPYRIILWRKGWKIINLVKSIKNTQVFVTEKTGPKEGSSVRNRGKTFSYFDQKKLYFWEKIKLFTWIKMFGQNKNLWSKFKIFTKVKIFDQNYNFWPKLQFLTKVRIFDQNYNFWPKL